MTARRPNRPGLSAADLPAAVLWQEGMLLAPPHFQEQDRRHERLAALLVQQARPFAWGILELSIDERALLGGTFRPDRLAAVLPDGLVVACAPDESALPEFDLAAVADTFQGGSMVVHLAVVRGHGVGLQAETERYDVDLGGPVVDPHGEGASVEVARLRPHLELLVTPAPDRPPPARYVSIPLASVRSTAEGFQLQRYAPPCLRLNAAPALAEVAEGIAHALRTQSAARADRLTTRRGSADDDTATDRMTLRALFHGLPRLEALLAAGVAHPYDVHLALADVVGGLAGLGDTPCPRPLRAYDHDDPLAAFDDAEALIQHVLGGLRTLHRAVAFVRTATGFELEFDPAWSTQRVVLGVRAARSGGGEAAAGWFEQAVVAFADDVGRHRQQRTRGAARRRERFAAELDLAPPLDTTLFRVDLPAPIGDRRLVVLGPGADAGESVERIHLFLPAGLP